METNDLDFENLVKNAKRVLNMGATTTSVALCGVGYALLAIAVAIKGGKEKDADKKE